MYRTLPAVTSKLPPYVPVIVVVLDPPVEMLTQALSTTTSVMVADVLAAKSLSPEYIALMECAPVEP